MKKSFTLIELLIVIIIMGILATISTKILIKVYKNYYYSKEMNKLSFETDSILNIIASKLQLRVKNSLIGVECNVTNEYNSSDVCIKGSIHGFDAISVIPADELNKYKVFEWLGKDVYARRGMWNSNKKMVLPGYSGFVDLKETYEYGGDEYNITTPDSNFTVVKEIDSNYTADYNISGDVFDNNYTVLVFSGPDDRGDFDDINHSYGYYEKKYPLNRADMVFRIKEFKNSSGYSSRLHIKAINESNNTTVYEKYYLINSAYALVPVANRDKDGKVVDYNITLFYNYYPWNKKIYTDGNSSLIASHVTQLKLRNDNGVIRILICIDNPKIKTDSGPLTVCKEKVVF